MPDILEDLWLLGKQRVWANRSDINEVEEAESKTAQALTDKSLGPCTRIRHVISKVLLLSSVAIWDRTIDWGYSNHFGWVHFW